MDISEAIRSLECTGHNYTIHKTEVGYECIINPKYENGELIQARAQAEGRLLPLVVYAALNELTI